MVRAAIKFLWINYYFVLISKASTMHFYEYGLLLIYTLLSAASFDFKRSGWLDKVVEYHKNKLFEEFRKVPDVEIKATIQPAPEGYVDSPAWDFDSVTRLLTLIRDSKTALPVRRVLRRMLGNTRRKMTLQESFKAFPSLNQYISNDIYYDTYSGEMYGDIVTEAGLIDVKDRGVIMVSNPVEARLPSAMISINLLRKILEERAKAARYMQTTRKTIPWKSMSKTSSSTTLSQNATNQSGVPSTGKPEDHTGSAGTNGASETPTAANNAPTTNTSA